MVQKNGSKFSPKKVEKSFQIKFIFSSQILY